MSVIATRILGVSASSEVDKNNRAESFGGIEFIQRQSERTVSPALAEAAQNSDGQELTTHAFEEQDMTVKVGAATRVIEVEDSENNTVNIPITFNEVSVEFTQVPVNLKKNKVSEQEDFDKKIFRASRAMGKHLESSIVASVEAIKTAIIENDLNYTFAGNTLSASWEDKDLLLGDLEVMMADNNFNDQVYIFASNGMKSILRFLGKYGENNERNERSEYDGKVFTFSKYIPNDTGQHTTGYAINGDAFGIVFRHEDQALDAREYTGISHRLEVQEMPMLGIDVTVQYNEKYGDQSGIDSGTNYNLKRAVKLEWKFTANFAVVPPYVTTGGATPVIKFQIAKKSAGTGN